MRFRTLLVISAIIVSGCTSIERTPPLFRVGDEAIARNFSHHPQFNGTRVRITGAYKWRWIKDGSTLRCYAVETVDGEKLAAQSFQLQQLPAADRAI
jgi:hypothetical protein